MTHNEWMTALRESINVENDIRVTDRVNEIVRENITQPDIDANWDREDPRWTNNVQALAKAAETVFGRAVDVHIEACNNSWLDVSDDECAKAANKQA